MRGRGDLSLWVTRVQLSLVVVSAALLAGAGSTGTPEAAALALLVACALAAVVAAPAVSEAPAVVAHRAWGIRSARIRRAEAPDRPGRPRPRAPGCRRRPYPSR